MRSSSEMLRERTELRKLSKSLILYLVRPGERHNSLSRPHRPSGMLGPRRVALRLGSALAGHDVYVDSPVCHTDRRRHRSRALANHFSRHVVLPTLGAPDLRYPSRHRAAYEPGPSTALFSIFATFICARYCSSHAARERRHCRHVLSAAGA